MELRGFRPGRDLSTVDMISLWTTANTMLRAYGVLGFDTPEWLPRATDELERGLRERRSANWQR